MSGQGSRNRAGVQQILRRIMCRLRYMAAAIMLLVSCHAARSGGFSVSVNLLGYAWLGTLNAEASYAFDRNWTVNAGAEYNPWTFNASDRSRQFQSRQQSYSAGVRFWPWHVYSGWWISGKAIYQEYNMGGIISRRTEEGDSAGAGFSAGYTHMLGKHFNIEFGAGFWTGVKWYTVYSCPTCGRTLDSGVKAFILPRDISISFSYVF